MRRVVLGDPALFDGTPDSVNVVIVSGNHKTMFDDLHNAVRNFSYFGGDLRVAISVQVPSWTRADHQAGKLPEIGSQVVFIESGFKHEVILITAAVIVTFDHDTQTSFTTFRASFCSRFRPVETTEEKQLRKKNEWVDLAIGETSSRPHIGDAASRGNLRADIGDIYDALKSKKLPQP